VKPMKLAPQLSVVNLLSDRASKLLVHAFISSRLDYCNSLLYGITNGLLQKLHAVNWKRSVVNRTRRRSRSRDAYWLVHYRTAPSSDRCRRATQCLTGTALMSRRQTGKNPLWPTAPTSSIPPPHWWVDPLLRNTSREQSTSRRSWSALRMVVNQASWWNHQQRKSAAGRWRTTPALRKTYASRRLNLDRLDDDYVSTHWPATVPTHSRL